MLDNAAIHKPPDILQAIHKQGHTPLFLALYLPILSPIRERGAKVKQGVSKTLLAWNELIADHIEQVVKIITAKSWRGWI
jgi:transposase